ncbi:PAS domain S-box protein [Arenibaculum pallidiluteum]|uniref:PAS domain S-box protein n=1 Tax=Arenibaculum pallidiluteum TaxID=2812559 RepID=UPI001A96EB69|nr:PAS domain S-box protein [Arenibaculum pallidiluteum]
MSDLQTPLPSPPPGLRGREAETPLPTPEGAGRPLVAEHGWLAQAFEHALGPVAILAGADHVLVMANPAFRDFCDGRDVVGNPLRQALPGLEGQGILERLDRVRASGEALRATAVPVRLHRGDGPEETRRLDIVFQPLRDAQGRVAGICLHALDVTERIAAERALRDTEERYRLAAQATSDAIWDWDLVSDHVSWNEAVQELFGHRLADVGPSGAWWKATIHPEDRGRVIASIQAAIARAGDGWSEEYRFRRADGSYAHVLDRGTVIRDGEGRALRMVGAMLDLSERKAVETALREREATIRSWLNAVPQMVWSTRPDGHHEFFNDRWYEFTGVPHGSTDGAAWNGIVHPDDRARTWERWRNSLATGEAYEIEYRLRHHTGEYRWALGRALPVRDETGAISRWMGTCTEIDELRRTADELRRTSALLRLIGDSTPDLIYAKDRDSRALYVNAALQRLVGRPAEEIIGRSDRDWAPSRAEAEMIIVNDSRVMESGEIVDMDEMFTGINGETRYYRSVKSPLRDEAGNIIGLVGVTSDMTDRRRAEERERLLAREVDHRAKNLLAVVQSVVQLTRAEDIGAFKTAVRGRIQSLARAHSLLAASRWEGADLMQLATDELAPFASRDASRLRIGGPATRLRPEAAQALALVLHELVTNAAKYGALSSEAGFIELSWQTADDGPARHLVLRWQERGGPNVEPPTRHGFGSTLIRASMQMQLKGTVELEWNPKGLVCTLKIPAEQLAPIEPEGSRRRQDGAVSPDGAGARLQGRQILVVEDEALIALQMEEDLGEAGCIVVGPASRIGDAFDLLYGNPVEAAFLDVDVAGERSFVIADILTSKRIPFAFVTGFNTAATLPDRFRSIPVVSKPFTTDELLAALSRLVRTPPAPAGDTGSSAPARDAEIG